MTYSDRLRRYEEEKDRLWAECSTPDEYNRKIRELTRKMKI